MRMVSRDEILREKLARRSKIGELRHSVKGDVNHIGKISTGCRSCFFRNSLTTFALYVGAECNVKCGECYYDHTRTDESYNMIQRTANNFADFYQRTLDPSFELREITYNSFGEPLMYMPAIMEAGKLVLRYQETRGRKVFSHMYTNGILATEEVLKQLKSIEVTELRFHLSASHWSEKVKKHMVIAKDLGFRVTIEEASLQEKKEDIFNHLPWFEEIGLDHLDLVECQVTDFNYKYLDKMYPEGRYYRDHLWHLYDEGLVYDVIEDVIKNNYSFSVIDCDSRVEMARTGEHLDKTPMNDILRWDDVKDVFRDFDNQSYEIIS